MAPGVLLQVCGRLVVRVGERRCEGGLPGRQGRELLVLLVAREGRPASRAQLIEQLWSGQPPPDAGNALSALLSKLRRALGPDLVRGGAEPGLDLPADAQVDLRDAHAAVHRAESAVATGAHADAWAPARVALHVAARGLLPGHEAAWLDAERQRLEDVRMRALECVGAAGLGLGGAEIAAAERSGRALIEDWPFRESGYRLLMEALARGDNIAEAILVYERLRTLLRDELGIAPSAELQELHRRLVTGRA